MSATVAFRVDASSSLGVGHLARCESLAAGLVANGARVVFALGTDRPELQQRGFEVLRMPWPLVSQQQDVTAFRQQLKPDEIDWIVVDHYGLDRDWEAGVRGGSCRILVIDDLADRPHDCDLLLDQNLSRTRHQLYTRLTPARTQRLLGPRYALLRPEFAELRRGLAPRTGEIRSVLVCFGGADPNNHTTAAVHAIGSSPLADKSVTVVIGEANPHRAAVTAACGGLRNASVVVGAADLAARLAATDLAIGAGGTMSWERACLGAPSVAFGIAANQADVVAELIEGGYTLGVPRMFQPDIARMSECICTAALSPEQLRGLSQRSMELVDGEGVRRVADRMLPGAVDFRPARLADSQSILAWRNDPSIRATAKDPAEIDPQVHQRWFERTLSDPSRILLIAEREAKPVAVVRFDLQQDEAVISIYRVPGVQGPRGLVRSASTWLRRNRPVVRRIVAEVRADNPVSQQAFRAAGYVDRKHELVLEFDS